MAIKSFREIIAWQKSHTLTVDIYAQFRNCHDYSFRDQIQRASLSIMNNIAEGYAKQSDRAFKNYLYISKGSAAEVESMLLIAPSLGYLTPESQKELLEKTIEVSMILTGFIRKLST